MSTGGSPKAGEVRGGVLAKLRRLIEIVYDLRTHYYKIGCLIGKYPRTTLFCAMLISLTSYGMYNIDLRDSIREGYTALDAPSRYETQARREFLDTPVDPMEMILLLLSKDRGSMHRKALLDEAATIVDLIYNMTFIYESRSLTYEKMCSPYCFSRNLFKSFKHYYDVNHRSATKSGTWSDLFNLSYPFASIWGVRLPLEQLMFGVVLKRPNITDNPVESKKAKRFFDFGNDIPVDRTKPLESQITNMEHVELLVLYLYGFKNTTEIERGFTVWELGIHDWTKRYNRGMIFNDSKVEVLAYGNKILDVEVNEDNRRMAPYFAIGFGCMLTMVVFCVLSISYYYRALDVGKILIGFAATLCPLLGITSTYGLLTLIGIRVNSLLLVMPFLIMGVGVDALFLMMFSWQKMIEFDYTPSGRLGMVFEECGPSITITSVTNMLAFSIGAITPTPEVRIFCMGSGIAMLMTYVYQLILFGPVLAIATSYESKLEDEEQATSGFRALINLTFMTLLRAHCAFIGRTEVAAIVFVLTIIYLGFSIQGVVTMKTRLDSAKILPLESELRRPNSLLMNYVWKEHLSPIFLVNNRFNMTDTNLTKQFWDVLRELESLSLCKGPASSHVWLRDFAHSLNRSGGLYPYHTKLNPKRLKSFLRDDHHYFNMTIRLSNNLPDPIVERFQFSVAYTNISNWEVRIKLMTEWREVIAKYRDLNMTVYEPSGFYVDQMLSLTAVTVQSALFTLASMTVVCAIFMGNLCSVIAASASMASISVGVIGFMSLLHFDLDPVVMVSLLMTIGMSVDYVAHVAYHLQLDSKGVISGGSVVRTPISGFAKKVENTVECVALPLAQSGLSTITCVLPLLFLRTYSSSVFVTAMVLVVIFGTLHSLVILPVFLMRLPEWVTKGGILRKCERCVCR
uniref:SSD domain-containing protein n=1 Tax=Haemonchus contortus TaxID=6289 RepID=A0A7I5E9V1_HAECO